MFATHPWGRRGRWFPGRRAEAGRSPEQAASSASRQPSCLPGSSVCSLRPSLPSVGGAEGGRRATQPDGPVMDQACLWDQPLFQPADLPTSQRVNPCIQQPDLSATGISVHLLTFLLWLSAIPQGGLRWDPCELKVGPHSCAGFPILRTSGKPRADHIFLPADGSVPELREQRRASAAPAKSKAMRQRVGSRLQSARRGAGRGSRVGVRKLQDGGFA